MTDLPNVSAPVNDEPPTVSEHRLLTADIGGNKSLIAGSPSDNTTVVDVLAGLADANYSASFSVVAGALLLCDACGREAAAGQYEVHAIRRMEGASDPDDMIGVVACRCPLCGAQGTVVLGYGPMSSGDDLDVMAELPRPGEPCDNERGEDGHN